MTFLLPSPAEVDAALSISARARHKPDAVFLVEKGETRLVEHTFADMVRAVEAHLSRIERPQEGRPRIVPGATNLECLIEILAALEGRYPILILPPSLPEVERRAYLELIDGIMEPLPEDAAVVLFTSGTSGLPKPAILSRTALAASARMGAMNRSLSSADRWLLSLSPARIGGLSILTRMLSCGGSVALGGKFSARRFAESLSQAHVTIASVVPTMLSQMVEEGVKAPAGFRALLVGGAPLNLRLRREAQALGWPIVTTYGMTECCGNVVTGRPEDAFADADGAGVVNDGAEVRITPEGEIEVRGPMRMTGYWGHPPLDPSAWHPTGDLGEWRGDALVFKGRSSERIKSGGVSVSAALVEQSLETIPEIRAAAVYGIPDERWGEVVAALLVAEAEPLSERDLTRAIRERLSSAEAPRRIAWVKTLPIAPSGKIDKRPQTTSHFVYESLHYSTEPTAGALS